MPKTTTYQYRPLKSERHIRLLKFSSTRGLLPRWKVVPSALNFLTLPTMRIEQVSIDDDVEFETLSYAWGDATRVARLRIAGTSQHIALTKSLINALPHLVRECRTGALWIDQMCINQGDVQERERQVAMMGDVFENSKRTLVWLGLDDESGRLAAECINHLHSIIPEDPTRNYADRSSDIYRLWELGRWTFSGHEYTNMIKSFRKCAWLSRAWVIQEFILAQSVTFLWGIWAFSTQAMYDLRTAFPDHMLQATQESQWSDPNNFVALQIGRSYFTNYRLEDRWMGLFQMISNTSGPFETTIDRDGLFSHLGLWKPPSFQPSYTVPLPVILIDFTRCIAKDTESLEFLTFNQVREERARLFFRTAIEPLPSWVPPWLEASFHFPLGLAFRMLGDVGLHWSASRHYRHRYVESGSSHLLCARGRIVDRAEFISRNEIIPMYRDCLESPSLRLQELAKEVSAYMGMENWSLTKLMRFLAEFCPTSVELDVSSEEAVKSLLMVQYSEAMDQMTFNVQRRKLMVDSNGRVGLVPRWCEVGDCIAIVHGCRVPLILSRNEEDGTFEVLGDCYLEGCMDGEAVTWAENDATEIVLR